MSCIISLEVVALLYQMDGFIPVAADDVFLAPGVHIIGRVKLLEGSSIWFNTVLRGDINEIIIGKYTNIQDNCTVHVDTNYATVIGDYVTVGHKCVLHGSMVGSGSLIGMGAILLDGARVGDGAVVAAGALVRERQEIPAGTLAVGAPARIVREMKPEEIEKLRLIAEVYAWRARDYRLSLHKL
jgi:carbonic anhydrase/acetyltransferase-like protein (isoleucine patch superfamily)